MSLRLAGTTVIVVLIFTYAMTVQQAEAAPLYKGKAIGIIIERSCLLSTNCLNYSNIIQFDNSDPIYSGIFIEKNGDIVRKCTSHQNNANWLQYSKDFIVMVDPCLKYKDQIPIISVISRLDEYQLPGQMKIVEAKSAPDRTATHQVRMYSKDRYVDSSCTNAIITAKNWQLILPDTINYLYHDCDPEQTSIKTAQAQYIEKTQHDISTSQKYKDEKKLEWIKANCLKSFGVCTEIGVVKTSGNKVTQVSPQHFVISLVE